MKAVILCGGMGTRIRDVGEPLPKPLLPIGRPPIVWHIMKYYASFGIEDFVLCLGYKSWLFKEFFLNYRSMHGDVVVQLGERPSVDVLDGPEEDWRVTLAETGELTMTGGRLSAVRKYLEGETEFMLTYGDGLADVDLNAVLDLHRQHDRIATVTAVRPPGRFGELQMSGAIVTEFAEKPQTTEGFINGGFFVFDGRRVWDYLSGNDDEVLEREPLQKLTRDGQLLAYPHDGFWQPMDTLREYNLLNRLWESGEAAWRR